MARHRLPGGSLEEVAAGCPDRLLGQAGDPASCTLVGELARPEVLLINKSRP